MKRRKLRPLGRVTADLEPLLLELAFAHELQHGEILNLIRGYLELHCPGARECYTEGGHPIMYYGPAEGLK